MGLAWHPLTAGGWKPSSTSCTLRAVVRSSAVVFVAVEKNRVNAGEAFRSSDAAPSPLFRPQALQAQQSQWLGGIRIGRNPRFALVAWVSLLLAAALIAFAAWGQITRKARAPGLLMPSLGTLQLAAISPGVLAERRVAEGQQVQAGDVLFVLATDRTSTDGATTALVAAHLQQRRSAVHTERSAREQQSLQRQQALADRIRALDTERARAEQEAQLAHSRVALARKSVERYQQLAQEGFVAAVQAQSKQEELIDLQARAQAAQRNAAALVREQHSLQADIAATARQWQADAPQLDRTTAALDQEATENQARKTAVVTAPQAGTVTALHLPLGAAVQAGQSVATLLPMATADSTQQAQLEAHLEAHLYAPSRTAGFVQAGQAVWLRYAAYPYQKFGLARGTVASVSRTPVNPQDLPPGQANALLQAAQSQEPLYRIGVTLAAQTIDAFGQAHALKPGMTLEADVVQERRAVWEWLLEPVLATKARMTPSPRHRPKTTVKNLNEVPNSSSPGGWETGH
jgi:membrane fusion protein